MSEIISHHAAHDAQQWRQLCEAAVLELDPAKLLQRIAEARSAVVDRIEDTPSKPSHGEQLALCDFLATLAVLRTIAERQAREQGEQRKTGT
jgi:hypothetical protein